MNVDIIFNTYGDMRPGPDNEFPTDGAEALEHSIEKYRQMLQWCKDHPDLPMGFPGVDACALCQLYAKDVYNHNTHRNEMECDGCPVKEKTGRSGCEDTPWEDVKWNRTPYNGDPDVHSREYYIQQEIDFLV